ncbi:MAG: efflux RND transporter permease subunit [Coriobacteriia bacterium]|nr:efflux RND transporter permease subunit [Coriobacteriia bacterium]
MSKFFTKFSIRNAAAVLILCILVSAGGLYSASLLKQEQMPDVSIPIVAVVTIYPGASPNDVLKDVTKPVEDSLSGVAGIKNVNSTSAESMSMVIAQFDYSQDMEKAKQAVSDAVGKVKLPAMAVAPQISRLSFGSMAMLKIAISNDKIPADQLEQAVRDDVLPGIQGIDGVANVGISGDAAKAVYVTLKPDEMIAHNVSLTSVQQQLQANNLSFPVGTVNMGDLTKPVRVTGTTTDVASVENLAIPLQPNTSKMLTDAFSGIGKGFAGLGQGMAGLGKGLGGLGSAVGGLGQGLYGLGYGLYGTGQATNGMLYLTNAISSMETSISAVQADKAALQATKAKYEAILASDPSSITVQAGLGAVTGQIAGKDGQLTGMKAAIAGMRTQLAGIQAQFGSSLKPPPALPKAKSSGGAMKMPSGGGLKMPKTASGASTIKLSEIADIKVGVGPQESYTRTNGTSSVLIELSKAQDANTVDVADKALAKIAELSAKLPGGTRITTIYDGAEPVKMSVNGMVREGALGALLAIVVILLFLRNFRATVISVISIPLSLLIAMVFLKEANVTLNVMTLGGLTVAIGRVVDDSIVVIENIFRHLSETTERTEQVIIDATSEVTGAITSSTLTTVAVFVPLGLVSGMVGKIFLPFALTVSLALLASLLVAVTVVPLVASKMLLNSKVPVHDEKKPSRALDWYEGVLRWSLDRKWAVFAGALALLVAAGGLATVVGTGFMPQQKERYVNIDVAFPPGTNVNTVNDSVVKIEKQLAKDSETRYYQTTVGAPTGNVNVQGGVKGANTASVFVRLNDGSDIDSKIVAWRKQFAQLGPADAIKVSPGGGFSSSSSNQLDLQVTGADFEAVKKAAATLTKDLAQVEGLDPASNNIGTSKPEILVEVDQAKAAKEALSAAQVAGGVRNLLSYTAATQMTVDNRKMDVKLGVKFDPLTEVADLGATEILNPMGTAVRLDKIATVRQVEGPVSIYAIDGQQFADIKASITAKDTGKVTSAVKALIAKENLPDGVKVTVAGTASQMSEAFTQLGMAMLVAVGAVYLVMVIAFGEATAPLAILFSLPLAAVGGIFGLFVVGLPLDMPAMIGALMLIGIVVTNAIVLIDRVQKNRKERGMPMREALVEAGRVRMRPIIMTAIATVTALLPLAMGMSEGALISQSLAAMVIGGLTLSTALTLIVVPAAFEMLERLFHPESRPKRRGAGRDGGAEVEATDTPATETE